MDSLITYDVPNRHKEVKDGMIAKGYAKSFKSGEQSYILPNTTIWRANTAPATALADLQAVTTALGVKLERAIATQFDNWAAIPGEPFK